MVRVVNIHEAKTHFSKLLGEIERGEEVIIARAGAHVARLVPISPSRPRFSDGEAQLTAVKVDALFDPADDETVWSAGIEP